VITLLAKTLAEMGQRVLLIDADLRKPQLHHRLGINNLRGLSNLLTDELTHWRQALQPIDGYEGWSVMTAGRRPPDPTRLLSSKRMHQLVENLESSGEFDLILFDTPPSLGLADSALVAEHCDGLMLLVSLNRVDRSLPKEAINRIRSSGAPLLGIVTNAIKQKQQGSSAYGKYGYGYGYGGYGYASYDTTSDYAHYAHVDDEDGNTDSASPQPSQRDRDKQTKSLTFRERLKARRSQFMRWVDN
jgi:capsular exopolysaccharide synthesis family protein